MKKAAEIVKYIAMGIGMIIFFLVFTVVEAEWNATVYRDGDICVKERVYATTFATYERVGCP